MIFSWFHFRIYGFGEDQVDPLKRGFSFAEEQGTGKTYEQFLERFIERWGTPDQQTLAHVLQEGSGLARVFSIWALAGLAPGEARQLLVPLLSSTQPKEKWSSALCLGDLGVPEAVPVLCSMLSELLAAPGTPRPAGTWKQCWYDQMREFIPRVLRPFQHPGIIGACLRALEKQITAEQWYGYDKDLWHEYQDFLAYELGYREAWKPLVESALPRARQQIALVMMVIGYEDRRHQRDRVLDQIPLLVDQEMQPDLHQQVLHALMEMFSFSKRDAASYLQRYYEYRKERRFYGFNEELIARYPLKDDEMFSHNGDEWLEE